VKSARAARVAKAPRPLGSALIDAMLHAVWLVDSRDLCIVAANVAAGDLMGVDPARLVGRDMLEMAATPEDLCFWGEVAGGLNPSIESDTWVRRDDGSAAPVHRRVSRLEAVEGSAEGRAMYVVALHDRSAERRAERELEAVAADLQATLESTADGILVTDLAGHIRSFNQRFAQLWEGAARTAAPA
jgi:PAS domain S-box-containing protein